MPRFMLACVLFVVVLGVPSGAAGQKQDDDEKILGTWSLVGLHVRETKIDLAGEGTMTFAKGGKLTVQFKGKPATTVTYKIDATKNPKQMDITNPEAKDKEKRVAQLGIFKLEGDTLILGTDPDGKLTKRPINFDPNDTALQIWKRQKP